MASRSRRRRTTPSTSTTSASISTTSNALPNSGNGVSIHAASGDGVFEDVIRNNGGYGILTDNGSNHNSWAYNSIFYNSFGGIAERPTPPSRQRLCITGVTVAPTGLPTITGRIGGSPNTNAQLLIQLYANPNSNSVLGYQGLTFIGQTTATTDANGNASFSLHSAHVARRRREHHRDGRLRVLVHLRLQWTLQHRRYPEPGRRGLRGTGARHRQFPVPPDRHHLDLRRRFRHRGQRQRLHGRQSQRAGGDPGRLPANDRLVQPVDRAERRQLPDQLPGGAAGRQSPELQRPRRRQQSWAASRQRDRAMPPTAPRTFTPDRRHPHHHLPGRGQRGGRQHRLRRCREPGAGRPAHRQRRVRGPRARSPASSIVPRAQAGPSPAMRESRATAAASRPAIPTRRRVPRSPSCKRQAASARRLPAGRPAATRSASRRRSGHPGNHQNFYVLIDGTNFGNFTPAGSSYASYTTATFGVTSPARTPSPSRGWTRAGGDNTAFIDAVTITASRRGRRHRGPADEHHARPDHPAGHHRLGGGPVRQSQSRAATHP